MATTITPFRWFDDKAEATIAHYRSGFPDAEILVKPNRDLYALECYGYTNA